MGKRLEQTFLQRRYTNGQHVHEKVVNITSYQQIKITTRYHLTHVRMAIFKKTKNKE